MFFLLRIAFWCMLVLVLLPSGGPRPGAQSAKIGAGDAVAAASAAVSDMSNFCERQPNACDVGAQAAVLLGQRAQAGARLVYDFINERWVHGETAVAGRTIDPGELTVGTIATVPASQNTLTAADLEPAWQSPVTRAESVPLPRPRKPQGRPARRAT